MTRYVAVLALLLLAGCFRGELIRKSVAIADPSCDVEKIDWAEDSSSWRIAGCAQPLWCSEPQGQLECTPKRCAEGPTRPMTCGAQKPELPRSREETKASLARLLLRCPSSPLITERLEFEHGDPLRDYWGWGVVDEISACGRVVWCGERDWKQLCEHTEDFETAVAQLTIETQCPREKIEPEQRQVFVRRTAVRQKGQPVEVKLQVSWRIRACDRAYMCSVTGGLTPAVSCKAALDSAADGPPPAPPSN